MTLKKEKKRKVKKIISILKGLLHKEEKKIRCQDGKKTTDMMGRSEELIFLFLNVYNAQLFISKQRFSFFLSSFIIVPSKNYILKFILVFSEKSLYCQFFFI